MFLTKQLHDLNDVQLVNNNLLQSNSKNYISNFLEKEKKTSKNICRFFSFDGGLQKHKEFEFHKPLNPRLHLCPATLQP